jgi:hypothetical protein
MSPLRNFSELVLEATGPVRGHARFLLAQHREDLFDLFVVDDVAQADRFGVGDGHRQREVGVRDLQLEVLLLLTESFALLDLLNNTGSVVRVDQAVTLLVLAGSHVPLS